MKLKIGEKELNVKYGYRPTLKERIVSKVVKLSKISKDNGEPDVEKVEDLLLFLPELLLVGLQVHHKDYRYDYDTGEGKDKQLEKTYALIDTYTESENSDIMELFEKLQEALLEDSFLAKLFHKEKSAAAAEDAAANQMTKEN